jgi:hypothetical protein
VIIFLNSINQLMFVMVKCGVLFEVRTEISTGTKLSNSWRQEGKEKYIFGGANYLQRYVFSSIHPMALQPKSGLGLLY